MFVRSLFVLVATTATVAHAQSLKVDNKCHMPVLLFTQSSFGSIHNFVHVNAGASVDMGISNNWVGAINVGQSFAA